MISGQNTIDKEATPKTQMQKMRSQPKPQTQKSVAFHTLAFCPDNAPNLPLDYER